MRKLLPAVLAVGLLFWFGAAPAAGEENVPPSTVPKAKADETLPIHPKDQWQFFFSPYLWVPGMNASTTFAGHTSSVNVGWWDMVPKLFSDAFGAMGRFEAWKGRWGLYLDSYLIYLAGDVSDSAGKRLTLGRLPVSRTLLLSGNLKYIVRTGTLHFGGRYLVGTVPLSAGQPLPILSLEVLGGGRFNWYNQDLSLGVSATFTGPLVDRTRGQTFGSSFSREYVEPFLGTRLGLWLTPKAVILVKGTVGGFGLPMNDNNLDADLELLFGYRVQPNIHACLGYRAYYEQADQDQISVSAWFHGPVLGAVFAF